VPLQLAPSFAWIAATRQRDCYESKLIFFAPSGLDTILEKAWQ